jgi:transmembrane sensor
MSNETSGSLDEAAATFARLRAEGVDASGADPLAAYVWQRSGELADNPSILALRRQATARPARPRWVANPARRMVQISGLAAAASAVLAVWLTGVPSLPWLHAGTPPASASQIATGPGEQREIHLEDGTTIRLEGRSAVRIADDGQARHVALLRGRAYFDVQHDPDHPFLVDAAGGEIMDVGTRFTVDRASGRVTVSLIEGKVTVREDHRATPLALSPGEQASFGSGHAVQKLAQEANADPLDWTRGIVTLDDLPLDRAVDMLSRYTTRPIHLADDPGLADRRVTGVFRADNAAGFPETLASALNLAQARGPDGTIVLSEKKKGG